MNCNICGNDKFVDMNTRKNVKCTKCGSLERTRLLYLYIQNMKIKENQKILHIAPERGIYNYLKGKVEPGNYTVADLEPEKYKFADKSVKIDLCDLDHLLSSQYDLIMHSHVLEHTPCNIAYTLYHLHRMLKEDGIHLCIIPFMDGQYDECFQDISDDERRRRFGQHDHVRRFGNKDISSHLGKLVSLPDSYDAIKEFPAEQLQKANIPENHWKGFHIGTVLKLKKHDMKLLNQGPSQASFKERIRRFVSS